MWTIDGEKVIEQLAGIEDFRVAMATYRAACERWPGAAITLRQGARVIESRVRPREETLVYPCPSATQGRSPIRLKSF
jgi:hypothetical protein